VFSSIILDGFIKIVLCFCIKLRFDLIVEEKVLFSCFDAIGVSGQLDFVLHVVVNVVQVLNAVVLVSIQFGEMPLCVRVRFFDVFCVYAFHRR